MTAVVSRAATASMLATGLKSPIGVKVLGSDVDDLQQETVRTEGYPASCADQLGACRAHGQWRYVECSRGASMPRATS